MKAEEQLQQRYLESEVMNEILVIIESTQNSDKHEEYKDVLG